MIELITGFGRGVMAWLVFGRKARVDCFEMVVDMMEAEFALERALEVTIKAARDQGQSGRAWVLQKWRDALLSDRFAAVAGSWVPGPEAMIFAAYGRVDGRVLFAAAARVAALRERQIAAVWGALAMPVVLTLGVMLVMWGAGGHFIPVLETVSTPESWGAGASLFRGTSTWLYANPGVFVLWLVGGAVGGDCGDGLLDGAWADGARQGGALFVVPDGDGLCLSCLWCSSLWGRALT